MLRRITTTIAIAFLCIVGFAPAALAGGSGPAPSATVDDGSDSITITATGMTPGETVLFSLDDGTGSTAGAASTAAVVATGSAVADSNGTASYTFTGVAPGTYTATATGQTSGRTQTFSNLTITAGSSGGGTTGSDGGTGGSGLADTGSDTSLPLARVGVVLLAAGAVAVYAGQRRRTAMKIDA